MVRLSQIVIQLRRVGYYILWLNVVRIKTGLWICHQTFLVIGNFLTTIIIQQQPTDAWWLGKTIGEILYKLILILSTDKIKINCQTVNWDGRSPLDARPSVIWDGRVRVKEGLDARPSVLPYLKSPSRVGRYSRNQTEQPIYAPVVTFSYRRYYSNQSLTVTYYVASCTKTHEFGLVAIRPPEARWSFTSSLDDTPAWIYHVRNHSQGILNCPRNRSEVPNGGFYDMVYEQAGSLARVIVRLAALSLLFLNELQLWTVLLNATKNHTDTDI